MRKKFEVCVLLLFVLMVGVSQPFCGEAAGITITSGSGNIPSFDDLFVEYRTINPLMSSLAIAPDSSVITLANPDDENKISQPDTRFAVAADPHYYDTALGTTGAAFEQYRMADRKLLAQSEDIFDAFLTDLLAENDTAPIDFLLICGDLTKDGEAQGHAELAGKLAAIELAGIDVYVIPGNHDINNPHAVSYDGENMTPVPSVSPAEFETIYQNFGYLEALYRDPNSLSYIAEPVDGVWLFALDSANYDNNVEHPETGGAFSDDTRNWILTYLALAQTGGKRPIGMMHHGILEHFIAQAQVFPEYVVEDYQMLASSFAIAGLSVMFTGHFHAHDITMSPLFDTSWIMDVETGSLLTWPVPWRIGTLTQSGGLNLETRLITNVNTDTGGLTFQDFARRDIEIGMTTLVAYQLTASVENGGYGLDAETAARLTPVIAHGMIGHYHGNEQLTPEAMNAVIWCFTNADPTIQQLGQYIGSLYTDLPPCDWMIQLDLTTGVVLCGDSEGDGYTDGTDNCPAIPNAGQEDTDKDGVGDACDQCPDDPNKVFPGACGCGVADTDGDGLCDWIDPDNDDDGLTNEQEGFLGTNTQLADSDYDGVNDLEDSAPLDNTNDGPVILLGPDLDPTLYGKGYGTDEHYSVLAGQFMNNGSDRLVHVRSFDIDIPNEVGVFINNTFIGFLTGNNAWHGNDALFYIPQDLQYPEVNRVTFVENVQDWRWGVDRLGIYDTGKSFGHIKGRRGYDKDHKFGFELHIFGKDRTLVDLAAWDSDLAGELPVYLNGTLYGNFPMGANNRWTKDHLMLLDPLRLGDQDNILYFHNSYNGMYNWGIWIGPILNAHTSIGRIPDLSLIRSSAARYLVPDGNLIIRFYDVDKADELEILENGVSLGFADITVNNSWGVNYPMNPNTGDLNVVEIDNTYNPYNAYIWGVRIEAPLP